MSEKSAQLEVTPAYNASQLPIEMQAMIEIEKARIESNDKRTDVALRAIEASDADSKRMFDYHVMKLQSENDIKMQKLAIAKRIVYASCVIGVIVITVLFSALFCGNDAQSQTASDVLKGIANALGGVGAYLLIKTGFNSITNTNQND